MVQEDRELPLPTASRSYGTARMEAEGKYNFIDSQVSQSNNSTTTLHANLLLGDEKNNENHLCENDVRCLRSTVHCRHHQISELKMLR